MPIPPNTAFGTAIDITSLPYSTTQSVYDTGTTTSYTVWYKWTATYTGLLGIWGYGGAVGSGYLPTVQTYKLVGGIPQEHPIPSGVQLSVEFIPQNKPVQIPVEEGEVYFFEFTPNANINPSDLQLSVLEGEHVNQTIPLGSLFINDDTENFPGIAVSSVDGDDYNTLGVFYPFPAGEGGDVLASGIALIADRYANELALFDAQLTTRLNTINFTPNGDGLIWIRTCQGLNRFYCGQRNFTNVAVTIKSFDSDGNEVDSYILPTNGLTCLAANNDGSIIYLSGSVSSTGAVRAFNTGTNSFDADLAAQIAGYQVRDLLVLSDDKIVVLYYKSAAPRDTMVKIYNAAGSVIGTYPIEGIRSAFSASFEFRLAYAIDDPDSFWVWTPVNVTGSARQINRFRNVDTISGSFLAEVDHVGYETGVYCPAETATPLSRFGHSLSCPFFVLREGIAPVTATLIIQKQTIPSPDPTNTDFPFNVTAPLTPPSFTLQDGDTQTYNNLDPGVYGVAEVVPPGWSVSYSVSNNTPPNAIVIAEGETVTVIVTNTQQVINPATNANSGIYRIVKDKRQDTLWDSYSPKRTKNVKIPDPFIKTGLIGK